jgi:hypothetical protein
VSSGTHQCGFSRLNGNEGRFEFGECAFGNPNGLTGQTGLLASSEPQSAGEGCNYDCCKGRYPNAVALNKTLGTFNVSRDDGAETGWLFFGGNIFVGIFILAYAALKEWRERALESNKNNKHRKY